MMVPPGPLNYFYALTDMDLIKKEKQLRPFVDISKPNFFTDSMYIKVESQQMSIPKLNYIDKDIELFSKVLTPMELVEWKAPPRPVQRVLEAATMKEVVKEEEDNFYDEDDEEKKRREAMKIWTLEKSIFATFKQDTDELVDQCFDYDYKCSRIERIMKVCTAA
jgi:hypothetical protein